MGAGGVHRRKPIDAGVGFRDVLRTRVFAILYVAETQSIAGDQLARIALSVLVYEDTHSAPATAATYAVTFLPALLGGFLLGQLGDRFPRRLVMIWCDVLRAAAFAVMALAPLPVLALIGITVVAVFIGPAFSSAQLSYLSTHLTHDQFRIANAMRLVSSQAAQVAGFAVGGVVVAVVDPRGALLVDAVTFAASALLVASLRGRSSAFRPGPAPATDERAGDDSDPAFTGVWGDRRLRALVGLSLLIGFFVVPEGLAVPFGRSVGASTGQIGLLLAAGAFGGALGAVLLVRTVPRRRRGFVSNWMAVASGVPLAISAAVPHWLAAATCWLVSGVFAAYIVETSTVIVAGIPDSRRSHVVGVVGALVLGAQGIGVIVFGGVGELIGVSAAVAVAGGCGSVLALVLVTGPLRTTWSDPRPSPGLALPRHAQAVDRDPQGAGRTEH